MGGYGSTRWGWHSKAATVEESKRLPAKDVLAGGPGTRRMYWTRRGEPSGDIAYTVEWLGDGYRVWLRYSLTGRDGTKTRHDYPVDVVTVRTAAGMVQYLWRCPLTINGRGCGRQVRYLCSPPGAAYFGCRHCYRLTYLSRQGHAKGASLAAMLARADKVLAKYRDKPGPLRV